MEVGLSIQLTFFPQLSLTKDCFYVLYLHHSIRKLMSQGIQGKTELTWENSGVKYPNMATNMAAGCRMSMAAP